jgi:hypothetical protein
MTWKRCSGCTRAIAVTAFSCEYCGQLCDDVMDFLPKDDRRPAAAPDSTFEPATDNDTPDYAAETARTPFEWESFPGESTPDVAVADTPPAPPSTSFDRFHQHALSGCPADVSAGALAEEGFPAEASANADLPAGAQSAHAELSAGARSAHIEPGDESRDYALDFLAEEPPASDHHAVLPPDNPAPAAPIASAKVESAKLPRTGMGPRQLAMVGGGVLAAGALIFTILGMRGAASPEPVATAAPARRAPAKAPTVAKTTPAAADKPVSVGANAPQWSRVADGRWVTASRHTAAFEVAATARVHVWMRDVTPVLVVRCEKGNAEAFVYTQSAARMEPQDGDHTVQVSFDGASPASQRWPDSAEHDALFARNPLEFTRQLSHARTLQFGFTPHNADAVVATFALDGLEPLLASSAKQCGWK